MESGRLWLFVMENKRSWNQVSLVWSASKWQAGKPCLKRLFWILPSLAACLRSNNYNLCIFLFISVTLTSVFRLYSYLSVKRSRDQIPSFCIRSARPGRWWISCWLCYCGWQIAGGGRTASHRVCLAFQIWCVLKSINGATWRHEISPCRFSQELLSKPEQACEVNLCHHDTLMPHLTPRETPGQAAIFSFGAQGSSRNFKEQFMLIWPTLYDLHRPSVRRLAISS